MQRRALLAGALGAALPGAEPPATVDFGAVKISRLIVGGNPVSGNSHSSGRLSQEMTDYFTAANVKRMLSDCERAGINAWQSRGDRHILRLLHEYRLEGGRMHWIAQTASEIDFSRNLGEMMREKPAGIYHHGARTDTLWQAGRIDAAVDALKAIRQAGTRVGLGTHIPEVIDYVESKGWDIDFYMTCVYNLSRSRAEAVRLAGPNAPEELFWDPDRVEMLKRVRQTRKQCLIFKVYGAGRHCDSPARMKAALDLAFASAKPSDAVVIGMFPKHSDQVTQNRTLVSQALRG
jgi:hypothetical protein